MTYEVKTQVQSLACRQAGVNRRAFTLIELVVTIGVIALVMAMALPSIATLYNSGADAQAFNLMSAMLTTARAVAIENGTYAGVHCQLANPNAANNASLEGKSFLGIVIYDDDDPNSTSYQRFTMATGYPPREVPGGYTFGQLESKHADGTSDVDYVNSAGNYQNLSSLDNFMTFTVVFAPDGSLAQYVNDGDVKFLSGDTTLEALWTHPPDELGATAFTLFRYDQLRDRDADARATYLNEYGQFIPVNLYTGQLMTSRK